MTIFQKRLKQWDILCQWSNPPTVNKTMEIIPANLQSSNQDGSSLIFDIELHYPGNSNDEKPEIYYKTNKRSQVNSRQINHGTEIKDDDNLLIPPPPSGYGLCSLLDHNRPAKISYLKKLWGGHLTLNGKLMEGSSELNLIDYIFFEWHAVKKGQVPAQSEEELKISSHMTGITPYIKTTINIKPKDLNPLDNPLIIEANYCNNEFYYSFGPINHQKITPNTEAPLGAIDATVNTYGLQEGAFIKLHNQGEYHGLITFNGTFINIKPQDHLKYKLTDVIIHQWELLELI